MRPDHEREYVEYVRARLPRLHRLAYLICADAFAADDIVQATLTALYVNWKRASAADNLDAYVHRIMVRRYIDERRRSWAKVLLSSHLPERAAAPAGDSFEERDALVAALRALPKGQRTVVALRYFGDLSVEATAEALGCSVGTVKSQCARGLAALRDVLEAPAVASTQQAKGRS
ncbi:SigE family RNA polymerase sigma factor [Phytohabitans houttuyneae]|uniref:RNA polymerase sigma24 factor n=1 Tax=Phytohabitans houttuyneae TaxID=1076126 RepID=A0A6V8K660_9ACTN|nr:SigE family RNA polymerase sigma factor [Phytohabitans houttuyneae]GFJ76295.1 RNA polymerase sigma24 factor [Phytohabitans houttuyneae]